METWAHANRWHDRVIENGFLAGGLLVLAVALPPFPGGPLVFLCAVAAATVGARVPLTAMLGAMKAPLLFLAVSVLPLLVSVQHSSATGWSIELSQGGWATSSNTVSRALGATAALILLGVTTPVSAQIALLRRARLPSALLDLMAFTYRMLFLLDSLLERMIAAQDGRLGYRNLRTSFRSASMVVAVLFSRTVCRARAMERGLAARGFSGDLRVLDISRTVQPWRLVAIGLAHGLVLLLSLVIMRLSHV